MVTEADSGSHSIIFTLSAAIICVLRAARLSVLRNKAENIKNISDI